MNKENKFTIEAGTISFWIKENKIKFNDNKSTPIATANPKGGSIFIIKDDDNKIKVFFIVLNSGRIDLEFDVSKIDSTKRHMIAFSWSISKNELKLYFDGKMVAETKAEFSK